MSAATLLLASPAELSKSKALREMERQLTLMNGYYDQILKPNSRLKCLVVAGPHGIGKTFGLQGAIRESRGQVKVNSVSGRITAYQVYEFLYRHSSSHDVCVFDDADSVFSDKQALEVFKAAIDPTKGYKTSWETKAASATSFQFLGRAIIITNTLIHHSPHYQALMDRVHYLNLEFTEEQLLLKIAQVAHQSAMVGGMSSGAARSVLRYMAANYTRFVHELNRPITLRTFERLVELVETFGAEWEAFADLQFFGT